MHFDFFFLVLAEILLFTFLLLLFIITIYTFFGTHLVFSV